MIGGRPAVVLSKILIFKPAMGITCKMQLHFFAKHFDIYISQCSSFLFLASLFDSSTLYVTVELEILLLSQVFGKK